MSEPETSGLPTEEEIAKLPRWAIVAFAARYARRVQPLFVEGVPRALESDTESIDLLIRLSENYAANAVDANVNAALANVALANAKICDGFELLAGAGRELDGTMTHLFHHSFSDRCGRTANPANGRSLGECS